MVSIEVGWLRDVTVPYPAKSPNPALLSAEATGQNAKAHTYLEGPILEAHIGTLHCPAVSHLLSDTTFPQLGILRVPLFVPVLAGFLLRTTQVRSAPVSNWQPLSHRRYHVRGGHRPKAHVLKVRYWKPIEPLQERKTPARNFNVLK